MKVAIGEVERLVDTTDLALWVRPGEAGMACGVDILEFVIECL